MLICMCIIQKNAAAGDEEKCSDVRRTRVVLQPYKDFLMIALLLDLLVSTSYFAKRKR